MHIFSCYTRTFLAGWLFVSAAPTFQPTICSLFTLDFMLFCDYHTGSHLETFPMLFPQTRMNPLSHPSTYLLESTRVSPALWSSLGRTTPDRVSPLFLFATKVHPSPIADISLDCNSLFRSIFHNGPWIDSGQGLCLIHVGLPRTSTMPGTLADGR